MISAESRPAAVPPTQRCASRYTVAALSLKASGLPYQERHVFSAELEGPLPSDFMSRHLTQTKVRILTTILSKFKMIIKLLNHQFIFIY